MTSHFCTYKYMNQVDWGLIDSRIEFNIGISKIFLEMHKL